MRWRLRLQLCQKKYVSPAQNVNSPYQLTNLSFNNLPKNLLYNDVIPDRDDYHIYICFRPDTIFMHVLAGELHLGDVTSHG